MSDSSKNAIPKLCDFGLAKILRKDQYTQEICGTLGFCAPEVI